MDLYDNLMAKLLAEGLFDQDHKKSIPFLPKTIRRVTSPTDSVIRDILQRLEDRFASHVICLASRWCKAKGAAKPNSFLRVNGLLIKCDRGRPGSTTPDLSDRPRTVVGSGPRIYCHFL